MKIGLKNNGKMAYLIPSNMFKNQFALNLRDYILPHLTDIYDYTTRKLFTGKLTASSIIVCNINNDNTFITYHNINENNSIKIEKACLKDKWRFQLEIPSYIKQKNNEQVIYFYFTMTSNSA